VPTTAAATPMTRAHPNLATSGRAKCGRPGSARENVPSPVHASRPMNMRAPHPGREQAGHQDDPQHCPAQARGFHQQERAQDRGAEQRADGGEAAGRGHDRGGLRWHVAPGEPHGEDGKPAADSDQGRLGSQHDPEAQRGQGRENDAGKLGRRGGAAGLERVGGGVAARARQVPDGRRDQQAGDRERQQRPPRRCTVKAEPVGQVREDLRLQVIDQGEEAIRRRGDRHAKQRGQEQQPEIALAPQQRLRVRCRGHLTDRPPPALAAASPDGGDCR